MGECFSFFDKQNQRDGNGNVEPAQAILLPSICCVFFGHYEYDAFLRLQFRSHIVDQNCGCTELV